jgi:hypothetical protein
MPARAIPQAEIDRLAAEGAAQLRKERAANAPAVLNLDAVLALGEPFALPYRGQEYPVKAISYREGVALQKAGLEMERMAKRATPPSIEEVQAQAEFVDRLLGLLHSLLEPRPAENPFLDATPLEVGVLLGKSCGFLMRQNDPSRSRAGIRPRTTH